MVLVSEVRSSNADTLIMSLGLSITGNSSWSSGREPMETTNTLEPRFLSGFTDSPRRYLEEFWRPAVSKMTTVGIPGRASLNAATLCCNPKSILRNDAEYRKSSTAASKVVELE